MKQDKIDALIQEKMEQVDDLTEEIAALFLEIHHDAGTIVSSKEQRGKNAILLSHGSGVFVRTLMSHAPFFIDAFTRTPEIDAKTGECLSLVQIALRMLYHRMLGMFEEGGVDPSKMQGLEINEMMVSFLFPIVAEISAEHELAQKDPIEHPTTMC